ncbi:MAG: VWA domain-containing protein [Clostridia bacterium]|nr:VWA domain-containing protein [Clostridia bacterium]
MEFVNPEYLYLLLVIPLMGLWYWFKVRSSKAEIRISGIGFFARTRWSWRQWLYHTLFLLRILAVGLLVVAIARPQSTSSSQDITIEGIDIVMAMDISSSMLAEDLKPNRLEAAKEVAIDFIKNRPNDRMGLVVFAGETFTQVPLTTDHQVLREMFDQLKSGMIEDGTALGDGLATAVTRLRDSKAISKVIILLTDGVNNMGAVDPQSAAEIAKLYGIRIYTIGVGSLGMAPYPVQTPFGMRYQNMEVKIDEALLQQIATMTDGKYFRATSNQKLEEVYQEIDQLEKSKIDVTEFHKKTEEFYPLALLALVLFGLEILFKNTLFRSTP